ncbi:uncharacterized protein LOC130724354 [Lotus japonicus]|uniref:uncharacterized protein LOC130724354 n=1 Tax=Lotus japonicus TaxID=34305 RepID=UPI002582B10D|nr:uncharacterized protein LOC130724354 [Lotus japonicus]
MNKTDFETKSLQERKMGRRHEDEQSRALYELSALVLNLLRSPPTPLTFSDNPAAAPSRCSPQPQISPSGFASLLLGISLALMLCGSVTFFIGFMLMPWVLGLVMVFYVAGIVSSLTFVGRSILYYATAPPKDIPAWKLM